MVTLEGDVDKSPAATQDRYKRYIDENFRAIPKIETEHYVYINKCSKSTLVYEAERDPTASYNKRMSKASVLCNLNIVRDNTLIITEDGIYNTTGIDRAIDAPGLQEEPGSNGDTNHTRERSQNLANKSNNKEKDPFVVEKLAFHVTENGDKKYVVRRYRFPLEKDTVVPTYHLPQCFATC